MSIEKVEVLIIGGGQAGLAMSEHLGKANIPHLILERNRIAERWRSERWDSLVANGPAWHDRFPTLTFDGDQDAFVSKDDIVSYMEKYAAHINAPVRCGVEVHSVTRHANRAGFAVQTSAGAIDATYVVAATGPFQKPVYPHIIPENNTVRQMHSCDYRNPDQLGDGVLVVGAGSSGVQIADELRRAGKKVYLSVGPHDRPPRSYRGRDFVWWLGVLGKWDAEALEPGLEHVTIAVSGAHGGHTVDFRQLAADGITLVGRTEAYENGVVHFSDDVHKNITDGDANYLSVLDEADAYVARTGIDLPEDPDARTIGAMPACVADPLRTLDLQEAGITDVLWSTGYALDYNWLDVDVFTENGEPKHHRGISEEAGLYFLGLAWLSRRGSPFIWVWHDAKFIADHIGTQRKYLAYRPVA
jgi:putative flavoprotein involved in K+ transport